MTSMPDREKLIDLIIDAKRTDPKTGSFTEHLADHLIANGVTVQEWISTDERLPNEEDADVAGCVLAIEISDGFARRWEIEGIQRCPEYFTRWMPLPQPPKGEQ